MGKFFGENAVQQVAQPVDQAEIDRLQQQYDALGTEAPTAQMTWNRQAPQEVAKTIRKEQGVASLPGVKFKETPMMDVYNPAYTDYMNTLNQYNYDKSQFDRNQALENARLASDWSGQRADLMSRMNSLKAQQGIGSLPGPFGALFGIVRQAPNAQVTTDPRAQTQQELAYQNLQSQYSTNPLVKQQYTPPINAGYAPLAATNPNDYWF
jgi:hypothetical protein